MQPDQRLHQTILTTWRNLIFGNTWVNTTATTYRFFFSLNNKDLLSTNMTSVTIVSAVASVHVSVIITSLCVGILRWVKKSSVWQWKRCCCCGASGQHWSLSLIRFQTPKIAKIIISPWRAFKSYNAPTCSRYTHVRRSVCVFRGFFVHL